ncbi:MAG: hypothetical protein HOP28_07990, partial [Gemmatimonadales bacterium]|nr:hypothetical protein [Gemmatimonadales bacterium]
MLVGALFFFITSLASTISPHRAARFALDTLSYTLTVIPDGVVVEAVFRGEADGTTLLALPSQWASQRELWRDVRELASLSPDTRIEAGRSDAERILHHAAGALVRLSYRLPRDTTALSHNTYF